MLRLSFAVSGLAIGLASCASTSPPPCSGEWVSLRMESALRPYAIKHARDIQQLREASTYLDGQSVFGAMRIAQATSTLKDMAESFDDDVMPEVRAIARQCGGDKKAVAAFTEFLQDEGVNREVLAWVDALADIFIETR